MNQKKALKQLKELRKYGKKLQLAAEWKEKWKRLISTILSARTRDEKTIEVSRKLYSKYSSIKSLAKAELKNIETIINGINYYKTKSRNVKKCAEIIVKEHKGKIPETFEELVKLPGVGRKTANVFLAEIGGQAIGVDTHVSYISRKLGWTKNKTPEKIENDLKRLFPHSKWRGVNYIVVRFGRTYKSRAEKDKILNIIKNVN